MRNQNETASKDLANCNCFDRHLGAVRDTIYDVWQSDHRFVELHQSGYLKRVALYAYWRSIHLYYEFAFQLHLERKSQERRIKQ